MIKVTRHVAYAIPRNCWLCVHFGTTAVYIGNREVPGITPRRLELLTPKHLFRWTTPRGIAKRRALKQASGIGEGE